MAVTKFSTGDLDQLNGAHALVLPGLTTDGYLEATRA